MLKQKLIIALAAVVLIISACNKDDDSSDGTFNPKILFKSKAYVASSVDNNLKTALSYGVLDIEAAADAENTNLLVLSSLKDVSDQVLQNAYENGKTIAVINPSKSDLDAFKESHNWLSDKFKTDNVTEETFIFAFTKDKIDIYTKPNDNGATSETYYVYLSSWLDSLNKKYVDNSPNQTRVGDGSMESISLHKTIIHKYTMKIDGFQFNKIVASDPDIMPKAQDTIMVMYDVYMVHVYEGQDGAGDYYGVKMWSTIANAGMWGNGQGVNKHGGVYVRWCGWYPTDFTAGARLCKTANWSGESPVSFTQKCQPSPNTLVNSSEYVDAQDFSITASQTAGIETGDSGVGPKAEVGVTEGWSWHHEEKRTVQDATIASQISGSTAQWHMTFNKKPEYKYVSPGMSNGFEISDSDTYRNTMQMWSSWLWYDENGKDNDDKDPYYFCSKVSATYEMQYWISSEADLSSKTYEFNNDIKVQLPKIFNATAGKLVFKNNLKDDMIAYDIEITENPSGDIVKLYDAAIANGEERTLGYFRDNKTYSITFKAKQQDGKVVKYKYTHFPVVQVDPTSTTTLDAFVDFERIN